MPNPLYRYVDKILMVWISKGKVSGHILALIDYLFLAIQNLAECSKIDHSIKCKKLVVHRNNLTPNLFDH